MNKKRKNQSQVVMELMVLSTNMSKSGRRGNWVVRRAASAAATLGVDYANGFLRGCFYAGITQRDDSIRHDDFVKAVSCLGLSWSDFTREGND